MVDFNKHCFLHHEVDEFVHGVLAFLCTCRRTLIKHPR